MRFCLTMRFDLIFIGSTSPDVPKTFRPCQAYSLAVFLLLQLLLQSSVVSWGSSRSSPNDLVHVLSRNQVRQVSPLLDAFIHICSSLLPSFISVHFMYTFLRNCQTFSHSFSVRAVYSSSDMFPLVRFQNFKVQWSTRSTVRLL